MSYLCKLTGRVSSTDHKGRNLGKVRMHRLITDRVLGVKERIEIEDEEGEITTRFRDRTRHEIEKEQAIHPEVYAEFVTGARKLGPLQRLEPALGDYLPRTYDEGLAEMTKALTKKK